MFTGGALPYLNKLRETCMTCRRLQPRPIQQLMGDIPKRLRGIGLEDTTTWRHQTCDLFVPFDCRAWLGQRQGQRASQSLKTWALLLCDYSTRAVRAAICKTYSTDSVLMALRTLWADTGLPTHLTFDAAQNITAAGTIFGGTEETERSDLLSKQLAGNLGHLMDLRKPVPYAAHRQGLVERNVGLVKKQLKILLAPTSGTPLTRTQASHLLSQATAFINRRPLVVLGAADQLGHLTPWYLSSDNMSVNSSQLPDDALLNYHPLTRRAVELQTRLEVFKRDFNTFYARSLRSYGKWRHDKATPSIGSIVYILDKTLPKQNFLQKFTVGKITRYLSDHTVELTYVKQSPEMTQGFIGSVRTGQPKTFSLKTCTRHL